jgi:hypothetical protein
MASRIQFSHLSFLITLFNMKKRRDLLNVEKNDGNLAFSSLFLFSPRDDSLTR